MNAKKKLQEPVRSLSYGQHVSVEDTVPGIVTLGQDVIIIGPGPVPNTYFCVAEDSFERFESGLPVETRLIKV